MQYNRSDVNRITENKKFCTRKDKVAKKVQRRKTPDNAGVKINSCKAAND